MKELILVLLGGFFYFLPAHGQYNRHIVKFRDKAGTPHTLSNPTTYLSARAITRRTKYNIGIDSTDLPITPRYLDSIRLIPNVTLLNSSKWLNQVAILTTDPAALIKINSYPFVQSVSPVAPRFFTTNPGRKFEKETIEPISSPAAGRASNQNLDYGQTFSQINIHNGQHLHNLGFQGEGMILAMLDGGFFTYKTNIVFDSIRINNQILGEWDFVDNNQNTDEASAHGMNCLSIIAANRPGIMVGSAPHTKFWLFRTEDVLSEYPVEEQNWVAAAEFSDSAGVDVISSSLGYQDFDDPTFDHLYPQRDGNTAIVTIGADLAAKKGMIVMNSAGNYGGLPDQRKYISCPADGDSVVAVGAVNTAGVIAGFSSWGPNSAGKLKPNIVSVGWGTTVASTSGTPTSGNGTSFSNPNIAGLITCLWGAFPEFSNMKVIDAVQRSSHKYNNYDQHYGYGIPDMRKAYYILKTDRSQQQFGGPGWFKATPDPFTDQIDVSFIADDEGEVKLYLKNITGTKIDSTTFTVDSLDYKTHQFLNLGPLPAGFYYVQYKSIGKDSTIMLTKGAPLFVNDWLRVFPNPFTDELFVYFKAQVTGTATLSVYDAKGRLATPHETISIQKDDIYNHQFQTINKLSRGFYFLRFTDGTNKRSLKIIKK